jgi:hypothetical protein
MANMSLHRGKLTLELFDPVLLIQEPPPCPWSAMKVILLDVIGLSYLDQVIIISLRFIRLLLNFEKLLLKSVLT